MYRSEDAEHANDLLWQSFDHWRDHVSEARYEADDEREQEFRRRWEDCPDE